MNSKYHDWMAKLPIENQMAMMRQSYSSDDSGVPLPVSAPAVSSLTDDESAYLDNLFGFMDEAKRYDQLVQESRNLSLPIEQRFKAIKRANLCIIEMGSFDRTAKDVADVVYGNFCVKEDELFAALGLA